MDFIKKTWVNKEDVPESELSQYPRFDANNMNRIEGGIEEALTSVEEHSHTPEEIGLEYIDDDNTILDIAINDQVPTFDKSNELVNLKSGNDTVSTAFGKIKKAIADFIDHLNGNNPHEISASQIGAAKSSHTHTNYDNHLSNKSNPHGVTASQIGLGNVDNTSDANKPVSTAQATAIADAKGAGTIAQSNLNTHTSNKSNPHGVTAAQIGATQIVTGTYTGDYTNSSYPDNPVGKFINLGFTPKAVLVLRHGTEIESNGVACGGLALLNYPAIDKTTSANVVVIENNGFSVYCANKAWANGSNYKYHYIAFK